MSYKRLSLLAVILAVVSFLSGCGGGSSSPVVSVKASASSVDGTDTITLAATVANDSNAAGVTWSVSGNGTLSSKTITSATYTAPAATTSAQTVTVTATSVADTTKTGTATLTVPAQLAITTTSAQLTGQVGTTFSVQLTTSTGISPYIWSLDSTSAALPTNWTLTTGGLLSCPAPTAGQAGTIGLVFDVTDSGTLTPMTASAPLAVVISPAAAITFTGTMPATATYGVAYTGSAAASGGAGALTYSATGLPSWLSLNASTGAITGKPTAVGAFPFTVTASDAFGDSASQRYTITASYPALIVTPATLPTGYVGSIYPTTNLAATGGSGTGYSFALASGSSLPAGLTLSAGGAITGKPTGTPGTANFTVAVTDSASNTANGNFSITIDPAMSLSSSATLPTGYGGTAYSTTLTATGGSGTGYQWTSSSLPSGFAFSAAGVLSATGTVMTSDVAGSPYSFSAMVTDSAGNTASPTLSLTIDPGVSVIVPTIPTFYPGASYATTTFTASGGSGAGYTYSWAAASGSTLPSGLSLTTAGAITGTPANTTTSSVPSNLIVTATDSLGNIGTATFSLTIEATLAISTGATLPGGVLNSTYSQQLAATGGTGASTYTWSTNSTGTTSLAAVNLTLSSAGLVSGTPATTGTATFAATVTDSASHTATVTFTVTASNQLTVTTSSLPAAYSGVGYSQQLAAAGGSGTGYTWSLSAPGNLASFNLTLTTGGLLSGTPSSSGTASFTAKVTDSNNSTATQQYTITVNAQLAVNSSALSLSTTVNQNYGGSLIASGGSGNYSWTVTGLPSDNLTYTTNNNTLSISGTPTTAEPVTFTAKVSDGTNTVGPTSYTITVNPVATLTVSLYSVPQGMVGMPYTFNGVSVSGGTGPYTITYTNAPAGLAGDSNNSLVGTPTSSGTTTVTVKVTDSSTPAQQIGTTTFNLLVVPETVAYHNGYLTGQYACYLGQYWDGGVTGGTGSTLYRGGGVFAIAVNGSGSITGGEMDHNSPYSGYASPSTIGALSGTYAVGADNRGYLLLTMGSSTPVIFALAGGNLNSGEFSEFAITEMDDAGTDPSGVHGSGHCYKQNTAAAFTGTLPSGGYVFSLTGEDSGGSPESIVGSIQFNSTTGALSAVQDVVDGTTVTAAMSTTGTVTTADSYGRLTMTAGPTGQTANTSVVYLTNNTKGAIVIMGEGAHNGTHNADFIIGEGRKQVATVLTASYPFTGAGVLYSEGTNTENASGSTPTYEAQAVQFTGSSSAKTITLNSMIENSNGTFKKDSSDSTGQTMTYAVDKNTGRVTLTGQTGMYFYLYDTNSAAVIFDQVTNNNDGTSGTAVQNMTGWIEPQTAPTSGSWAIGDFATSYFMSKIENGDHNNDSQTSVLSLDSSGNINDYAEDDGGSNWASWDEGMTGNNGTTETAAVVLDTTDGTYGLFDVNMTESGTTTTQSYCFAISVDAASNSSSTKGKLVCVDKGSDSLKLSIMQE